MHHITTYTGEKYIQCSYRKMHFQWIGMQEHSRFDFNLGVDLKAFSYRIIHNDHMESALEGKTTYAAILPL